MTSKPVSIAVSTGGVPRGGTGPAAPRTTWNGRSRAWREARLSASTCTPAPGRRGAEIGLRPKASSRAATARPKKPVPPRTTTRLTSAMRSPERPAHQRGPRAEQRHEQGGRDDDAGGAGPQGEEDAVVRRAVRHAGLPPALI